MEEEGRAVGDFTQRLGARFERVHRARQQVAVEAVERAADQLFDARGDETGEARVVGFAQIMAVEILELLEIETRRRAADMVEVEPLDRLATADDFVVA